MSPRLRPLRLPALVAERKKLEDSLSDADSETIHDFDMDMCSNVVSPVTPTFMRGHLRYASSTSSFEIATPASSEPPSSPAQVTGKRGSYILPDVQEEPYEHHRDSFDDLDALENGEFEDLYSCLCDEPCIHQDNGARSSSGVYSRGDSAYEYGFFSDSDLSMTLRSSRKPRSGAESPLSGITQRIGSKFTGITSWRKRGASVTQSPVSEYGFDQRSMASRADSRSSSVSASVRYLPDRRGEPALPPTPALSFYESSDSIALPVADKLEKVLSIDAADIERDRALATTPLLPPFMNEMSTGANTAQASPLASPKVASSPVLEPVSPLVMSPPLSSRPSVSSFHRMTLSGELPGMPEEDETWCNLLGHANYTILPLPYKPSLLNLDTLYQLRADWATARCNYTKHLARTGEHYGLTSKTYSLTEQKWAETQAQWRRYHDQVAAFIVASGAADSLPKFDEDTTTAVPHMDTEGKFPERGDEDIVGPMIREACMVVPGDSMDRRNANFWRTLAGRVGLRK